MTKKEAIEALYRTDILGAYSETHEAVNMAIKALKQEPCEDCISRVEALKNLALTNGKDDVYRMINSLSSFQPKPMQVELEGDGYADGELVYDYGKCPKCGWDFEYGDKDWEEPYCCHCGQRLHWFESEDKE